MNRSFFANPTASAILTILISLYVTFFCTTSFLTYWDFGMSAYDIGIHDQALWKLSTNRGFFNTIRGMNIWGDHCWIIMALIAPLYVIIPRLETLLALQSIALAAAALPLAAYAYRRIGSRTAAILLASAFLLSPALQNMNLENAHPEVLALPFLLWMIAAAEVDSWLAYGIALLLALFCKEDIALTTFAIGCYIFIRRNKVAGAMTMLLSIVYFLICMKLILPYWNGSGFFRFQGGYWFSDFWIHKFDIAFYHTVFTRPSVSQYLEKLLLPIVGIAILDPLLLLAALPGFLVNVLSGNTYLIGIDYHYNYHTLPILFAATASGIARLSGWLRSKRLSPSILLALLVFAASAIANYSWSQAPVPGWGVRLTHQWQSLRNSRKWSRFAALAANLPQDPDIPIAASHNLVPALTHRNEIYMFPNPWKINYWGIAGENVAAPDRVMWLMLDMQATKDATPLIARLFNSGEFQTVAEDGPWLVAKRVLPPISATAITPGAISPPTNGDWLLTSPPTDERVRALVFQEKLPLPSLQPFVGQQPLVEVKTDTLEIPETNQELILSDAQALPVKDNTRILFVGKWQARGEGETMFRVHADDGCRVYLDGEIILDYDGPHAMGNEVLSKPLRLTKNTHVIMVDYFEWGGHAGLRVEWREANGQFNLLESGSVLP